MLIWMVTEMKTKESLRDRLTIRKRRRILVGIIAALVCILFLGFAWLNDVVNALWNLLVVLMSVVILRIDSHADRVVEELTEQMEQKLKSQNGDEQQSEK